MDFRTAGMWSGTLCLLCAGGCMSPFYTDQGALFGGVTGAGVGAVIGEAVGNPLAGAAIGAGVGTLTGAAVGNSLDEIEARNRAQIAQRLGRPVPAGAVAPSDVVAMVQAGVEDEVIVNHIQIHGPAHPLGTGDLIYLKNSGVSARVVQALQSPPRTRAVVREVGPTVIVPHPVYGPPMPGPPVFVEEFHFGARIGPRRRF